MKLQFLSNDEILFPSTKSFAKIIIPRLCSDFKSKGVEEHLLV